VPTGVGVNWGCVACTDGAGWAVEEMVGVGPGGPVWAVGVCWAAALGVALEGNVWVGDGLANPVFPAPVWDIYKTNVADTNAKSAIPSIIKPFSMNSPAN